MKHLKFRGLLLASIAAVVLSACGGGGGGGSSDTPTFAVAGSISGLTGSGLVLSNNATDTVSPAAGATAFAFGTKLTNGATYSVAVKTQPSGQTCSVSNGTGTISGQSVGNVSVTCTNGSTSYAYGLNNLSQAAVSPASGKVLVAQSAFAYANSTQQVPLFLLVNRSSKTVEKVVQLNFDATGLRNALGTEPSSYDIKSLRATNDGGAVASMDVFGTTSSAKAHVVAKLSSTLTLDWAKVWAFDQFGTIEVQSGGYVSSGNKLVSYDLNGTVTAKKDLFSTFSVSTANVSVVGALGGYRINGSGSTQLVANTSATSHAYYAGTSTAAGGVLMVGYGYEGSTVYPIVVETDLNGIATTARKLDVATTNGTGFRDVVSVGGSYYAVGNYLTGVGTNIGWMVCKFGTSVSSPTCKSVASGSGELKIASDSSGNLLITRQGDFPVLVLNASLDAVYVPTGYTLGNLAATASNWSTNWNYGSSTAMVDATAAPAAVTVGVTSIVPSTVDTTKLSFLLQ